MYANVVTFGPRSADLVAADDYAGTHRIMPAIAAREDLMAGLVATIVLRKPNGEQLVITIAESEDILDRGGKVIMATELLPDEDPALLPGADSFDRFEVVHTMLGKVPLR